MACVLDTARRAGKLRQVVERDGWECWLCGQPIRQGIDPHHDEAVSLDHVVPLSEGGNHAVENLRPAHRWCNSRRGNRRALA